MLAAEKGIQLKFIPITTDYLLDLDAYRDLLKLGPKLVAFTHMSNVLGTVVDIRTICTAARALGVPVLVDGSQAAVHLPVNVAELGCDFYVITGHKLYGPTGSGALYARRERLAEMRPFHGGGDMIREVRKDAITYADPPLRMEAGTPGIVQTIGLGVALGYMTGLGMESIAADERTLRGYASARLQGLNWLNVQGKARDKGAIFSFTLQGAAHPHDISTVVDRKGVAVRAGHHCAQPLMAHLGVTATCRASFGLYNTTEEIEVLVDALETCHELFS
jgi:cysteine desulfurase/selenocysteine lyase